MNKTGGIFLSTWKSIRNRDSGLFLINSDSFSDFRTDYSAIRTTIINNYKALFESIVNQF